MLEKLPKCPKCGYTWIPWDAADCKAHKQRCLKIDAVIKKYGGYQWYEKRELTKKANWPIVDSPAVPLENRIAAAVLILQSYFYRDIYLSRYSLKHPVFENWAAVFLADEGRDVFPAEILDRLMTLYPGSDPGPGPKEAA